MSEGRPATRATNTNQHPGLIGKRKRRTKAEMEEVKIAEQEAKAEKERVRREKLERIAALESEMAEEDAREKKAELRPNPRPLKAAKGYRQLPAQLPIDQTDEEASKHSEEAFTSNQADVSERTDEETDQETPKKKKGKVKIPARDAIKAIKEEAASRTREEGTNAVSAPHHFLYINNNPH
jgi:hypothetical protein